MPTRPTYYDYNLVVNSELVNDTKDTTLKLEIIFDSFRSYIGDESDFEYRYENDLVQLLLTTLDERIEADISGAVSVDGIVEIDGDKVEPKGIGFIQKDSITEGDYAFTENQLDRDKDTVRIKRVSVNGSYKIRFYDNNGTFKRINWSQDTPIDEVRSAYFDAWNLFQRKKQPIEPGIGDVVTDSYEFKLHPSGQRGTYTYEDGYEHETQ